MKASLAVTVCILNWNGRGYLRDCLESVYAQSYLVAGVVVVDNGSTDDSVRYLLDNYPQAKVVASGANVGFAAGNNVALRSLETDVALLLNPDVVLSPDCLEQLVATLETDSAIGVAGCKLWYPGGEVIQHAGGAIRPPQAMPDHFGVREVDEGQYDQSRDVDYVIGAATVLRRELIEDIGLLDDGYFLYYEDSDYCARARRAGYRVVYEPRATGIHVESAVAVKDSPPYFRQFHRGRWRYLLKHYPSEQLLDATVPAELAWQAFIGPIEREAVAHAYGHVLATLPDIWRARLRDGGPPVTPAEQKSVAAGLRGLLAAAWGLRPPEQRSAGLPALGDYRGKRLVSHAAFAGPLVEGIRNGWNALAGREYVDTTVAQQSAFYGQLQGRLATTEGIVRRQTEALVDLAEYLAAYEVRNQALAIEVARLRQALETEAGRLAAIRRGARPND